MIVEYKLNVELRSLYNMLCGNFVMPKSVSVAIAEGSPGGITLSTNKVEDIEQVASFLYEQLPRLTVTMTIQKPSPTVAAVLASLGILEDAGKLCYVCADLDTITVKTYSLSVLKGFASKIK